MSKYIINLSAPNKPFFHIGWATCNGRGNFFFKVQLRLAKHDRHIMQSTHMSQIGKSHEAGRGHMTEVVRYAVLLYLIIEPVHSFNCNQFTGIKISNSSYISDYQRSRSIYNNIPRERFFAFESYYRRKCNLSINIIPRLHPITNATSLCATTWLSIRTFGTFPLYVE